MARKKFTRIQSISELHRLFGVNKPKHPAISLIRAKDMSWDADLFDKKFILDFYMVSLKYHNSPLIYGRNYYDFEEGTMVFTGAGQAIQSTTPPTIQDDKGWMLFVHPDFMRHTSLGEKMQEYTFFSYALNEALHLSEQEQNKLYSIVTEIEGEYSQHIDKHSHTLMVSNLELLLNHCRRFYDRQFLTRSVHQQGVVVEIEKYLRDYFHTDEALRKGLPTVSECAAVVNLSPNYLSDLLKKETGKTTQEHIHYHLIEKAKDLLLTSDLTINKIAYDLGFEYPQYFGNLFKRKVGVSPNEYRNIN